MHETVEQLQQVEAECLSRFRRRAQELRAAHPDWTERHAFCKSVESLPKTLLKYQNCRALLEYRGIPALPLH